MEETVKNAGISKISKNPIVTIDTSIKDMLKWDADGKILDFDTSPEGFKDLTIEVMKELSFENKSRYQMAKTIAALEAGSVNDDWKNDITITEQYASPTERIEVKNPEKGFAYYASTPDKIAKHEAEGYKVVPAGSKESIGLSGRNTIGTAGREELVLMKTTEENAKRMKAESKRKRDFYKGNVGAAVRELGDRQGINTFDAQ